MAKKNKKQKGYKPFFPIPAEVDGSVSFADPKKDGFDKTFASMRGMEVERPMLKDPMRTAITLPNNNPRKIKVAKIKLGEINRLFAPNSYVSIHNLKYLKAIKQDVTYLKVKGRGKLTKPLIVEAHEFKKKAVSMLTLTGGRAVIVK